MSRSCVLSLVVLLALGSAACGQQVSPGQTTAAPPAPAAVAQSPAPKPAPRGPTRDLSIDESMGGHTLSRHVGKTDTELRERLRREPQISAASTYTDRATAEHAVGAAIAQGGHKLKSWTERTGRRPNLVLEFTERSGTLLGRSLARAADTAVPCEHALVVLRWDERRDRFYVLTSYPEAER